MPNKGSKRGAQCLMNDFVYLTGRRAKTTEQINKKVIGTDTQKQEEA